jgi:hypothetical protein
MANDGWSTYASPVTRTTSGAPTPRPSSSARRHGEMANGHACHVLVNDPPKAAEQAVRMAMEGKVRTITGKSDLRAGAEHLHPRRQPRRHDPGRRTRRPRQGRRHREAVFGTGWLWRRTLVADGHWAEAQEPFDAHLLSCIFACVARKHGE